MDIEYKRLSDRYDHMKTACIYQMILGAGSLATEGEGREPFNTLSALISPSD
jgi:hypothetical protein